MPTPTPEPGDWDRLEAAGVPRWRHRPRLTLWRWDASRLYATFVIFAGGAWVGAGNVVVEALDGTADSTELVGGLLCLLVAIALTYLTWLFLRRPVVSREQYWAFQAAMRAKRDEVKSKST